MKKEENSVPLQPLQRMEVLLPGNVNTRERHLIHIMSWKNMFDSASYNDTNGDRRMRIYLSKAFVAKLSCIDSGDYDIETIHETDEESVGVVVAEVLEEVVTEVEQISGTYTCAQDMVAQVVAEAEEMKEKKDTDTENITIVVSASASAPPPLQDTNKKITQKPSFFQSIFKFVCRFGK
jgi:hypothetical protein